MVKLRIGRGEIEHAPVLPAGPDEMGLPEPRLLFRDAGSGCRPRRSLIASHRANPSASPVL